MNAADARALFSRHLDLSRLRHRSRGVVLCIFHSDRTPSLSVDVEKGLFNCFACGTRGGVRRFAQLVGESVVRPARRPGAYESPLQAARRHVLRDERRRQARGAPWAELSSAMRELLLLERLVARGRAHATTLGPDSHRAWEILADAANVETFVNCVTADLEGVLASGRVA